ncbi:ribonuclease III [Aliifodinibius sp. S!AR15-10]|uniref:ribonuclease III n=1 Tax=Aliifodinibius sp. S!AR15-10 TaxID=2950437 RepID=UPI00285BE22D|nr:ribonuclease III [Aliifodinibius sp. S!AR15-10]MDR8390220.1 ribonuclease III [Aliifodinibius sp. S!AR15-10]
MFKKLRSYFTKTHTTGEVASEHETRLENLKQIIKADIDDPHLFVRALRHRSVLADESYSPSDSYERLEFLGDAVLDLIITEIIYQKFPQKNEGFLTKLRAKLVKGDALATYARKLNLSDLLVLGERAQGQGIEFSKSILADVFEALVGALYMDQGYNPTFDFVGRVIQENVDFDKVITTLDNHKSILLEYAQAHKLDIPEYEVVAEEGPGHDKTFEIRVIVDNKEFGKGKGKSKKEAEQLAAKEALQELTKE